MPKTPKPKQDERDATWANEQKEREYYYDDAHGYEEYDPEDEEDEGDAGTRGEGEKGRQGDKETQGRGESDDSTGGAVVI